jgi:hypothetical protein
MIMAVIKVDEDVVYNGPAVAVPRQGDAIIRNGSSLRVEGVTWEFSGPSDDGLTVVLHVGDVPYTF